MNTVIKVFIVEDDADFVYLTKKFLENQGDIRIVGYSDDGSGVIEKIRRKQPDIVLVDLHLGNSASEGILLSRQIRIETSAKTLILTGLRDFETIQRAARTSFASGYIFKNQPSLLLENIRALAAGTTAQEYMIASYALSDLSDSEMSAFLIMMGYKVDLKSTVKTIANQKGAVLKKLGLSNQKEVQHVFRILLDEGCSFG